MELSRTPPTLSELLSGFGDTLVGVDRTLKELLQGLIFSAGVQARMDGIMFQRETYVNSIFKSIKDYLNSL